MKILKISHALILIIFSVLLFNVCPCVCNFTSFVFGDSLVDAGNNNYFLTLSKANNPPYGIDFKPSGGHPTGRFTNGRTISDIIGQALGAKSYPPPFLSRNALASSITEGVNYASGASGILKETGTLFIGRIPLGEQVNYFEQSRSYMVTTLGEEGTKSFLKKSIFSLTIGSNDVLNYYQPSIPFLGTNNVHPTIFQDFMISNLTVQLKKCSVQMNTFIQGYNDKLRALVHRLNQESGPDALYVYANSYNTFMEIIENYRYYGFENVDDPCCGGYFPPYTCFEGSNQNTSSVLCGNRSEYIFWDAYPNRSD